MNTDEKQPLIFVLPPDLLRVVLALVPEYDRYGHTCVGPPLANMAAVAEHALSTHEAVAHKG